MLFEKPNTNPEDHTNNEKSNHPQISNLENKPINFRTRKIRNKQRPLDQNPFKSNRSLQLPNTNKQTPYEAEKPNPYKTNTVTEDLRFRT